MAVMKTETNMTNGNGYRICNHEKGPVALCDRSTRVTVPLFTFLGEFKPPTFSLRRKDLTHQKLP